MENAKNSSAKNGKGMGRAGAKQSQKRRKGENTSKPVGTTNGTIRRLARKGGVKRLSGDVYPVMKRNLELFLETLVRDTLCYTENSKRLTVLPMDVIYALKRQGKNLLGFAK